MPPLPLEKYGPVSYDRIQKHVFKQGANTFRSLCNIRINPSEAANSFDCDPPFGISIHA